MIKNRTIEVTCPCCIKKLIIDFQTIYIIEKK